MPIAGPGQFKAPKTSRRKEPVKHVALSDDAKRAYEQLSRDNADRDVVYGRHLNPSDNKRR